jgi:hypothetical protein
VGQQRGVVAAAGADLQDLVARLGVELTQHRRHDRGLAGTAQGGAVRPAVAGHGVILVDALDGHTGQEVLAGHGLEGRSQARVAQQPIGHELVDQPLVQLRCCGHHTAPSRWVDVRLLS